MILRALGIKLVEKPKALLGRRDIDLFGGPLMAGAVVSSATPSSAAWFPVKARQSGSSNIAAIGSSIPNDCRSWEMTWSPARNDRREQRNHPLDAGLERLRPSTRSFDFCSTSEADGSRRSTMSSLRGKGNGCGRSCQWPSAATGRARRRLKAAYTPEPGRECDFARLRSGECFGS